MAGSAARRRGSPTVPVIGMLKYCSVTVRGENKEALERIEREHVPLPRSEIKWGVVEVGGGRQRGAPPAQQDMCHSLKNSDTHLLNLSSAGEVSSDYVREGDCQY